MPAVNEPASGLGVQIDAVERLGDGIVELTRQPLALFHDGHLLDLLMELGLVDDDGSLVSKETDDAQVLLGKAADLVDHVQDADDRGFNFQGSRQQRIDAEVAQVFKIDTVHVIENHRFSRQDGLPGQRAVDGQTVQGVTISHRPRW